MRERLIRVPARDRRLTTGLRFAARTWIECDCQQAGLSLRSLHRLPPRSAAPTSNCRDEQRLGEHLAGRGRIAMLRSPARGNTRAYRTAPLCGPLAHLV